MTDAEVSNDVRHGPGGTTWLIVACLLTVCALLASWPRVLTFGSTLPTLADPLQHLWIMRWYRTCLLEGRPLWLCPEVQAPIGAPLGNFSPLHAQAILYLPLSFLFKNNILCYNLIWLTGMVLTGLGTFALAWSVTRDRPCSAIGGLLAMLSAPMMLHGTAHLELIFLGGFPLFLTAWLSFVDRPDRCRLTLAAASYVLLAMCAAYYAVFAMIPAALYVCWEGVHAGRRQVFPWLKSRLGWLIGFSALVAPCVLALFANSIWAMAKGYSLPRSLTDYTLYTAPWWTYLTPTTSHRLLGQLLPGHPYSVFEPETVGERASYLGVVTLGLLAYTALARVRFPRAGYWWLCLTVLVVLSFGAYAEIGPYRVGLPALWLKQYLPTFRLIRVPSRFNLFAAVFAAVIASAGLRHLLDRLPGRSWKTFACVCLTAVALADLATVQTAEVVPPLPKGYEVVRQRDPSATIVEAPQSLSAGGDLSALCAYWQTTHRLNTTAGYSGQSNVVYDNLVGWSSPFMVLGMTNPAYLAHPESVQIDVVHNAGFNDYVWLYLATLQLDYVVLHQHHAALIDRAQLVRLDPLKQQLACAKIFEDNMTVVYDRCLLPKPTKPVLMVQDGWRSCWPGPSPRVVGRSGTLSAYNPDPARPLRFAIQAKALRRPRIVRLLTGNLEIARWTFPADQMRLVLSDPFLLPAGLQTLTLETDGEER
ncbi:MAG: hypothetical protein ABI353_11255, partial [Isosphaeraceae bacterium]